MRFVFTEWLPDLGDLGNPGSIEAKNVIPSIDGYKPLPSLSVVSDALDSACLGGFSAIANDGTIYTYAGSTESLYELRQGFWKARLHHFYDGTPGTLDLAGATADVVLT